MHTYIYTYTCLHAKFSFCFNIQKQRTFYVSNVYIPTRHKYSLPTFWKKIKFPVNPNLSKTNLSRSRRRPWSRPLRAGRCWTISAWPTACAWTRPGWRWRKLASCRRCQGQPEWGGFHPQNSIYQQYIHMCILDNMG